MNILYEDDHLCCVNKAPGVSVQRDKTGDISLEELAGKQIRKNQKPFTGIAHRIDKPVSGIVILAKTKAALAGLNRQIMEGQWRKVYWAIVGGAPPAGEGRLVHFLKKNGRLNKSFVYDTPAEGAKEAELRYVCIGSSEYYSFLSVELKTGRHHQIRAQLAHVGCPIKGDIKYGAKRTNREGGIGLHAYSIELDHPVTGERLKFAAEPPDDVLWRLFVDFTAGVS